MVLPVEVGEGFVLGVPVHIHCILTIARLSQCHYSSNVLQIQIQCSGLGQPVVQKSCFNERHVSVKRLYGVFFFQM